MATQVVGADLTVPAGTLASAPATLIVANQSGWLSLVRLTIPPGHNGVTGWSLAVAGTKVIPYSGQGWVVGNDQDLTWDLERWVNQGQLEVLAFNTGLFSHTFHCLVDWDPNMPQLPVSADLVSSSATVDQTSLAVAGLVGLAPETTAAQTAPELVS